MATRKIKCGGKVRHASFNLNAFTELSRQYGMSLNDLGGIGLHHLRDIAYHAFAEAAYDKGQDFDHDPREVGKWLSEAGVFEKVQQFFTEDFGKLFGQEEQEEGNVPGPVTGEAKS